MSHIFSKKPRIKPDNSSDLPKLPSVDQIIEDLEAAKPDDIVFTTDIGLLKVEDVVQEDLFNTDFSLQKRFQKTTNCNDDQGKQQLTATKESLHGNEEKDDLYEQVIEYNQNVEKLVSLHKALPNVLQNLTQLQEELQEDNKRVSDTYKDALKLHQSVNSQDANYTHRDKSNP